MFSGKGEKVDWVQLVKQCPREVVLSGEKIAEQIEKENGLNELIFELKELNFLEITSAPTLTQIDIKIAKLNNLTNLVLEGNKLKSVPVELGQLTKLKCLDLSRNEIESLPETLFDKLTSLQTLNLEQNKLLILPDMSKLTSLITLKCGSNQLTEFPGSLCNKICSKKSQSPSSIPIYEGGAIHLSELNACHNLIEELPLTIGRLVSLKTLNLSYNRIEIIPNSLANCTKLKDVNLKENPVKDRRLYKLIEQCPTKKILDYLRLKKEKSDDDCDESNFREVEKINRFTIHVSADPKEKFLVIVSKLIANQRKIVACILHGINLSNPKLMKKFFAIQTKIHQGTCDNRQKATIATHDLRKMLPVPPSYANAATNSVKDQPRVVYFDGKVPTRIRFTPLGRAKEMTALELYRLLNDEADQYRKEKKRNTISGIHKYIHLLKGKPLYPVLLDSDENVLSLPPLTNSEYSKVNADTLSVFVEVTGESIQTCRMVMNEFIYLLITCETVDDDGQSVQLFSEDKMVIEPVIVEEAETHNLMVKYPAKIDLKYDDVQIIYE